MSIFFAVDTFERFYREFTNDDLRVQGISYGEHFFPDPEDYPQAIALAEYVGRSIGLQVPSYPTFWNRIDERWANFDRTPPPTYDIEDGPYAEDLKAAWDTARDTVIGATRILENEYFFGINTSNFVWDDSAYVVPLTYPGADPTKKYLHARYPMDLRAAAEYWQYRVYWYVSGFQPQVYYRRLSKAARAKEIVYWEGPSDPICPAAPGNVRGSGAMLAWARALNADCIDFLTTYAPVWQDIGQNLGTCPRQEWIREVSTSNVSQTKWLGSQAFTGFLEIGHTQGYECDVQLGLSRVLFSVVTNDQVPEQNRQVALHIGIFQDYLDELGTWNVELITLPDDTHLLGTGGGQWDAFNDGGNEVIATFPVTDLVDNILIFPLPDLTHFYNTPTGRMNYGLRMEGDTVGWAGGGNLVVPDNVPLNGADQSINPNCFWDQKVAWGNSDQAGVAGTCSVNAQSGIDRNVDPYFMIDNTFVFINVTAWYPELMGMDFWP